MRLAEARVLLVGIGGLGCPIAEVLARAGVGHLTICDDDVVEWSNLHRQPLFEEADVGRPKVRAAADRLRAMVPGIVVDDAGGRFLPETARALARTHDIVLDGSDNFATKFLVSDACILESRPVIHGAAVRWEGTIVAVPARGRPCYRCLFEDLPEGNVPNCATAGVIGPLVGLVGALQADAALDFLESGVLSGSVTTVSGRTSQVRRRPLAARLDCESCGGERTWSDIDPSRYADRVCEFDVLSLGPDAP